MLFTMLGWTEETKQRSRRPFWKEIFLLLVGELFVATSAQATAELVHKEEVAPGVLYRELVHRGMPWRIQVLEVERNTQRIRLGVGIGGDTIVGTEPLPRLAQRHSTGNRRVLAAVNADFFENRSTPYDGDLSGLCMEDGDLLSTPNRRTALGFTWEGSPVIGRFQFEGTLTRNDGKSFPIAGINQECPPNGIVLLTRRFHRTTRAQSDALVVTVAFEGSLRPNQTYEGCVTRRVAGSVERPIEGVAFVGRGRGAAFFEETPAGTRLTWTLRLDPDLSLRDAVGGGPRLLREGMLVDELQAEGISKEFAETRHPRTAFGYNAEKCFLVTVDGRQKGYSVGMTLRELALFLRELGATEALNLDGGGSTTMWVQGAVRNRPSDGRVRPIGNALLVYQYP